MWCYQNYNLKIIIINVNKLKKFDELHYDVKIHKTINQELYQACTYMYVKVFWKYLLSNMQELCSYKMYMYVNLFWKHLLSNMQCMWCERWRPQVWHSTWQACARVSCSPDTLVSKSLALQILWCQRVITDQRPTRVLNNCWGFVKYRHDIYQNSSFLDYWNLALWC